MQAVIAADEQQEGHGCAAQLDAGVLDDVLASGAAHDGLRASLHDVWQGHKEDPNKVRQRADATDIHINLTVFSDA